MTKSWGGAGGGVNKNAPRFREALCVLRYRLLRLLLSKHKTLTGEPGGSGHGHSTEAVLVHCWAVFYAREGNESRGKLTLA